MNNKKKSDVFTFDENVTTTFVNDKNQENLSKTISKDEIKNIPLKNNDKNIKNDIDKLIKEDPFFFF